MGNRYISLPLCGEKSQNVYNHSTITEAAEKNEHRFGIPRVLNIFYVYLNKFKSNPIYLIKLATDCYWQQAIY